MVNFGLFTMALAATTALAAPQGPTLSNSQSQKQLKMCGTQQNIVLTDTPWIVYNMWYNKGQTQGTMCTQYNSVSGKGADQKIKWSAITDIQKVRGTDNIPKGYTFVGLTRGFDRLTNIKSIPASYEWKRTNTTEYKGNIAFDFMTSDTKGDSTSSKAQELMLWLEWTGGQLPIGWVEGPKKTIPNLFGTSWKLYQGKNTDTGITVSSLLPDKQFASPFKGDLKQWLVALAKAGVFKENTYVNVGNAGTEPFYGKATVEATLGLQINL